MTVPTVSAAPSGQVASFAPPLAFSRTAAVAVPVMLTIERRDVGAGRARRANVTVKPPLPALATVAPPGKPAMALIAAWMLALLTAAPPRPIAVEVLPPSEIVNDCVAGLKLVSVTCCCSLPPWIALAMPAAVLFWPRTIGCEVAPRKVSVYESPLVS